MIKSATTRAIMWISFRMIIRAADVARCESCNNSH